MLQKIGRGCSLFGIFYKAPTNKVDKLRTPLVRFSKARRWFSRDHKYRSHRVNVAVRRFALGHFQGGDTQRPYVGHAIVTNFLYHLGRHPERCTNDRVTFRHGILRKKQSQLKDQLQCFCCKIIFFQMSAHR